MSLILDHINYIYGDDTTLAVKALNDICLTIPDGQFIGIIGHTGSGKSTLVQHLNGLLKASSGSIYFNGEDIYDEDFNMKKLRSKVGLPDDLFYQSPFELSGGQKRRVAIAGVLAMKPDVLILDEPTAGLDPKGRDEILGQIKKLQTETGMTIILVSHSMEDVAEYVDRIIVMNKGSVMYDDVPKNVFRQYRELEEVGLAAPQVTYIMHELQGKGLNVDVDATTIEEATEQIYKAMKEYHA